MGEWGVDCGEGRLGFRRGLDEMGDCGDFGRLWMRRENVGIIETERCI